MHELVLNAAKRIIDSLQVGRERLAQQVSSVITRRAAEQALQQGATVIEISRLCEAEYNQASEVVTTELLWVVEHSIYPRFKFVSGLERMGIDYIDQLGGVIDEHMKKAENLSKSPPHGLGLHLQTIKERAQSHITTSLQRRRIERVRKLLLQTLGILASTSVLGYLIKFLITHFS
jgi:hypothetical protein